MGLSGVACGGGGGASPPPNCLQAPPCGGDVVGTWSLVGGCVNLAVQNAQVREFCPGGSLNGYAMAMSGTLTFNADSTYTTSTWTQTFAASLTMSPSCLGVASCADASETIDETLPEMTRRQVTTCTGTASCTCYTSGTVSLTPDFGTWLTSGTALEMLGGATTAFVDYCVEGDRLHMVTLDAAGASLADSVAVRL